MISAALLGVIYILEPHQISKPLSITPTVYVAKPQQAHASLPVRLKIPRINIDATIEYLGLTANGEMATTQSPSTVAWYQLGQRPGDLGSAVIAGHFGWKNNLPAAFDHLSALHKGDSIYIQDETGAIIAFVVQDIRIFGKNDDASSIFNSSDGKSHLNLITCEGTWSNASRSYSNRLVVFTNKQ